MHLDEAACCWGLPAAAVGAPIQREQPLVLPCDSMGQVPSSSLQLGGGAWRLLKFSTADKHV
jgi:hypothetical protein